MLAAKALREKAIAVALADPDSPLAGAAAADVLADSGWPSLSGQDLAGSYAELLARNGLSTLPADADYDPVEEANGPKAIFSFSAVFAEV